MMDMTTQTIKFSEMSEKLINENIMYENTGGISQGNKKYNFIPAFLDFESGTIYISSFSSGLPAPIHIYDGLPGHLVITRDLLNKPVTIKNSVVSGFVFQKQFYTREQAMRLVERLN